MRYIVLTSIALGLTTANVCAQDSWAEKMFRDGSAHDFGSVPRGALLSHQFKMTNIYDVPLEISIRVSCGCVTASPSSRVLKPLEQGTIDVVMDAGRFSGAKSVNIYVTVGPKFVSTATLTVNGISRVDVVLNPGEINFGPIASGQPMARQILDAEYAGALDWRITELDTQRAPVEASFKESLRLAGRVSYRVTVSLKPSSIPAGPFKYKIFLKTNDPSTPLLPIVVEGSIQSSLTAVPNVLSLGNLKMGESITKLVMVKAGKPFRILSVDGMGDGVVADLPASKEQSVQVVKVTYQPKKAGALHKQLSIKTDLEKESQVTVTLEGAVEQ